MRQSCLTVQQRLLWSPRPRGRVLLGCDATVAGRAWLDDQELDDQEREAFLYRPVPGALIWLETLAEDSSPQAYDLFLLQLVLGNLPSES